MDAANNLVIKTEGLGKEYQGKHVLQDLNLQVAPHSIFGFLGPNGAGKSTTIKLLLGLIHPSAGHASVFGLDSVRDSVAIRQRVGYLAQEPRYYEDMTARETLRFTARFFYAGPANAIEDRVAETLDLVGLSDKADRPIKGFSGGERQRLGIGQAQVNYPDLLILDEPAASLDPMGRHDVLQVMERLREHSTVFYSTHILDDVQRVSDTVAILNHGRLVAEAPIGQLLAGDGAVVYALTVKTDHSANGDVVEAASTRIAEQPWVSAVTTVGPSNGTANLQVSVTDEQAAESELLRLILCDRVAVVTEFGRKKHNLEEVFLEMVGGAHAGQGGTDHDRH